MKTPHKHAELIKQWADGAQIEFYDTNDDQWYDVEHPAWDADTQYRVIREKWYDQIPTQGILCWTWCGEYDRLDKRVELIFGYLSDTNLFHGSAKTFKNAIPLTKEEIIDYFVENQSIVNSKISNNVRLID